MQKTSHVLFRTKRSSIVLSPKWWVKIITTKRFIMSFSFSLEKTFISVVFLKAKCKFPPQKCLHKKSCTPKWQLKLKLKCHMANFSVSNRFVIHLKYTQAVGIDLVISNTSLECPFVIVIFCLTRNALFNSCL